jgi:DNA-binding transcriptional MerR regulator
VISATVILTTVPVKLRTVRVDHSEFLEFLQLGGGEPRLVTKSELLAEVRERGFPISDRQLTFYVSEGLLPRSVRVGSRAGAYPSLVVDLLTWILRFREMGVPIEAIKELLPVWKSLIRARNEGRLDLAEFEYVVRQQLESFEAILAVPTLLTDVVMGLCPDCRRDLVVVAKDGRELPLTAPETTIGFAAVRRRTDESGASSLAWWGYRRITLAGPPDDYAADPTTVVLGVRPNEAPPRREPGHEHQDRREGRVDESVTQPVDGVGANPRAGRDSVG